MKLLANCYLKKMQLLKIIYGTFIAAIALAYFEVFFAWAKVQMQTFLVIL